jgi:hypothetical protein
VVIEAPSTASSADAQSLASVADAAILAVELRRTSYAQVMDASEQLRRVGTPVLGAVVMARLGRLAEPSTMRPTTATASSASASAETTSPRPSSAKRGAHAPTIRDERRAAQQKGRAAELANSPTVVLSRIGAPLQPTAASTDHPKTADRPNNAGATELDEAFSDEFDDDFDGDDLDGEDAEFDDALDGVDDEFEADDDDEDRDEEDEDDNEIVHLNGIGSQKNPVGRPAGGSGTAEQRKTTATGMLAALTEDGPLDATR